MLRQDLKVGLGWLVALFGYDAVTSLWAIDVALKTAKHAPGARDIVAGELTAFSLRMFGTYLLMGLVAGLLLHLTLRALGEQPGSPTRRRSRWALILGGTAWLQLRGAILWPRMFVGMPLLEWYISAVKPGWISAATGAGLAGWMIARLWRGRASPLWLLPLLGLCGLLAAADHQPAAATAAANAGPNVLIVGVDALRPDHMGFFGYERDTTPALDRFLAEAEVFDAAFTPLPRTWAAWNSILTGTEPLVHGQRESLPPAWRTRPRVPMLTDALVEAGYHTRFLTDDSRFSYMLPEHNFQVIDQPELGALNFALSRAQPYFRPFFTFLNGPLTGWRLLPVYRYNQAFGITWRHMAYAEHVADQLAQAAEHERFFMAVHLCTLHAPGDRPYPYHLKFGMGDYRGGNRFKYRSTGSKLADGLDDDEDDSELEALERESAQQNLDLYDAGITMVDETWARIERALTAGGLWENTLVIVLSDHGEDFLEESTRYRFRGPNHGFHPWGTGQQRVLLAAKGPGFTPGERREELASLLDIAPTVAKQLGLEWGLTQGYPLQEPLPGGRVLFGETGVSESNYWAEGHVQYPFERKHERYTVDPETLVVYQRPEYDEATVLAKDRWALDDEWWLVEEALEPAPRYSLFRWREDPTFADELSDEAPEALEHLKAQLSTRPREP
jgi:arylsulfatase A-like enzyme